MSMGGVKKKKANVNNTDKILKVSGFLKTPRTAEEIRKELKDRFGFSIDLTHLRISLLRLLRQEKIQRKKDGAGGYKYYV
jgi:hypothetical protein